MIAAVVETLNVPAPSPPVPTMSTASAGACTRRHTARMARAAPVTSAMSGPFICIAVSSAESTTSLTSSPFITSQNVANASSSPRCCPACTFINDSMIIFFSLTVGS